MTIVGNTSRASTATVHTSIGDVSVSSLNDWNNTSFSQLCLGKSESDLLALSRNGDLDPDKQSIAQRMYEQRHEETTTGNHV